VTGTDGERAEVEIAVAGHCDGCGARGLCNWTGTKSRRVLAVNRAGAAVGDAVVVELVERARLGSNLAVFGIPAGLMLAGTLLGGLLISDTWAVVLAGAGLALGLGVVKLLDGAAARNGRSLPVIVRIGDVEKGANCEEAGAGGARAGGADRG
jgi:positive regulator of sigma E activity